MKTQSQIEARLKKLKIKLKSCTIHEDGTVDVDGDVDFDVDLRGITEIGIKFGNVTGNFNCNYCKNLTSLEGAPRTVGGYFSCSSCIKLVSLEGAPTRVDGDFSCNNCYELTSLKGAPSSVGGCFSCNYCVRLSSIAGVSSFIGHIFYIIGCELITSLAGIDKLVKKLSGRLVCDGNVKSHVLGLTRIAGFTGVLPNTPWAIIVNKHLHHTLDCQSALLDAGLEEYAKL